LVCLKKQCYKKKCCFVNLNAIFFMRLFTIQQNPQNELDEIPEENEKQCY
jgi:hypothetical protein